MPAQRPNDPLLIGPGFCVTARRDGAWSAQSQRCRRQKAPSLS